MSAGMNTLTLPDPTSQANIRLHLPLSTSLHGALAIVLAFAAGWLASLSGWGWAATTALLPLAASVFCLSLQACSACRCSDDARRARNRR
jgi:methyl-accepting chemotaxis protein